MTENAYAAAGVDTGEAARAIAALVDPEKRPG